MSWQTYKQTKMASLKAAIKEGKADKLILPLLRKINLNPDLVSLSSCSGRIVLLMADESGKKNASFYAKWHGTVDPEDVELELSSYSERMPLWFRVEPFILHIAAKDLESARGFMDKLRKSGVKRGGIQVIGKERIMMEFQGTGYLAMPVDLVSQWNDLIAIANGMMKKNKEQIRKIGKIFS